jgi:chromosomal replication initiator protein
MAHAASIAVGRTPGQAFNPLFIYGGTGLGKTHLLHSIARQIRATRPDARITYVSAEEFTNQVVKSIQNRDMDDFRARFRKNCDVLLMDDAHVLAGKERTQEEFFYTFNALHEAQKQIVLTSDKTPQEIPRLEERLRSRFQWGLITDIKPPQLETRVAILKGKADREAIELPSDVAFYLASLIRSNVRELEGALVRLTAYASFNRRKLTVDFAEEALRELIDSRGRSLTVDSIIKLVADHFDVKSIEIKGKRRHRIVARPRSIAMYLCRKHTQASFPQIGKDFGGKDHTTVMAACRKVDKTIEEDDLLRAQIDALERKLPNQG